MPNKNLTIIDADSIAYFCGHHESFDKAIETVDARIDNIISNTNADYIALFISKGKYFRHDIYPQYKSNRTSKPPKWMRTIKTYLEDKYKANWMHKAEADDLVAYWMNQKLVVIKDSSGTYFELLSQVESAEKILGEKIGYENINLTMAAIDKDLLKSIPGKHWNYTFKSEEEKTIQGWFVDTYSKSGWIELFFMEQMLLGDNSDGVLGCGERVEKIYKSGKKEGQKYMSRVGITAKDAEKMKDKIQDNVDFCLPDVFNTYIDYFGTSKGVYEFQKNYRLLHMLGCDEDYIREIGSIPIMPKIIDVKDLHNDQIDTEEVLF